MADYPPENQKKDIAVIYSKALLNDYTFMYNSWGLPGYVNGIAARNFINLGKQAIPELFKLLDNENRILYYGSKDAMIGNSYKYRIKDLAAFYISEILKIDYKVHLKPEDRDIEIFKLKSKILNSSYEIIEIDYQMEYR